MDCYLGSDGEAASPNEPHSYVTGALYPGRVTLGEQVCGKDPDKA